MLSTVIFMEAKVLVFVILRKNFQRKCKPKSDPNRNPKNNPNSNPNFQNFVKMWNLRKKKTLNKIAKGHPPANACV